MNSNVKHGAIVGSSGCGKTLTIMKLLQRSRAEAEPTALPAVVILDLLGEWTGKSAGPEPAGGKAEQLGAYTGEPAVTVDGCRLARAGAVAAEGDEAEARLRRVLSEGGVAVIDLYDSAGRVPAAGAPRPALDAILRIQESLVTDAAGRARRVLLVADDIKFFKDAEAAFTRVVEGGEYLGVSLLIGAQLDLDIPAAVRDMLSFVAVLGTTHMPEVLQRLLGEDARRGAPA